MREDPDPGGSSPNGDHAYGPSPRGGLRLAERLEGALTQRGPGKAVPAIDDLATVYGVSPRSIRQALVELERRFVVRRLPNRELIVASRVEYRIGSDMSPSWTETVRSTGAEVRSFTERARIQRVPPRVRMELELGRAARVYVLSRRRFVADEPAACSVSYVVAELAPGLPDRLGPDGSLHAALKDPYGLDPVAAWMRAEMEVPPPDIPKRLGMRGRPVMVSVRWRTDSAREARPVELTASWMRADIFRVMLEVDASRA
jgi:GntR family transcriptional regulator